MKTAELKVGVKGNSIKVPCPLPENLSEVNQLARGDDKVVLRWATRGYRIEAQERSGARDAVREGKSQEEVAQIVAGFDPTEVRARTATPKKPIKLQVPKGRKPSLEDFKAQLAAAGVQVEFEEGA